jgi:hypothetical protein
MALSADTPRIYELGDINEVPVKASTSIYEGAAVGMTSGYARGLVAGDQFVGFAQRKADNSATATDGYINCKVISKGLIKLTISGIAVTDIGKAVYASADGTFTLTEGSNSPIGTVYRYVTTDTCVVAFANPSTDKGVPGDLTLADGTIIVGSGSNVGAAVTPSGDVTITNAGVTAIGANKVLTAMISANQITSAKISANQILTAAISDAVITEAKLASACLAALNSYAKSYVTSHVSSSGH